MSDTPNPDEHAGWELIWRSGDIPPRYRSTAEPNASVVEWAETLPPGGAVLDIGCGVGRHVLYLGGRGFQMAGMDVSPSGIRITQAVCAERQIPFDGHVGEMTTLPWPDATFDAALSTSTIHHNRRADILRTLDEVRRVLKPGGLFQVDFISTARDDYQQMRALVAAGEVVEIEPDTFIDERADSRDSDGFLPHHYCDEAEVRDLLRGFEILRLWDDTQPGSRGKWIAWARRANLQTDLGMSAKS